MRSTVQPSTTKRVLALATTYNATNFKQEQEAAQLPTEHNASWEFEPRRFRPAMKHTNSYVELSSVGDFFK